MAAQDVFEREETAIRERSRTTIVLVICRVEAMPGSSAARRTNSGAGQLGDAIAARPRGGRARRSCWRAEGR
jgi:hypothetical protein